MTNKHSSSLILFFLICTLFSFQALAETERTCEPLKSYLDEGNTFILNEVFYIIRDTFKGIAEGSWSIFSLPLQAVVAIGISIYIAMYTLKNIGSFSNQDVSGYLGKVIPLLLKGAFIIFLLGHPNIVYEWLVSPIIEAGAVFSDAATESTSVLNTNLQFKSATNLSNLFNTVIFQAKDFNQKAYRIVAMGRLLLCAMLLPDGIFDWHWSLLPFGATLFVFGWLIIIGVSFYMLDVIFRLGVGCTVLPLALACSLSKLTSEYTKKTWGLFINVAFSFVMLNIVINFAIRMIQESLNNLAEEALEGTIAGGLEVLLSSAGNITDAAVKTFIDQLQLKGFILMSLSCLIAFKLCMEVDNIVNKLSGEKALGDTAQKMGGSLAHTSKNIAMEPVSQLKSFTGSVMDETSTKVGKAVGGVRAVQALSHFKRDSRAWIKRNVFRLKD